ncbi:axonemal 84 kDa protein-like [Octopus sinensis]|uniref:Axonemal 84 kDa protein-like n=1 Tax=Octopus sinensis TaxID=2607531 RepID=A0A7E6EHZ3_9MOLL|nr:axonemal 84 kDa protein-like [Octopus sinensis]
MIEFPVCAPVVCEENAYLDTIQCEEENEHEEIDSTNDNPIGYADALKYLENIENIFCKNLWNRFTRCDGSVDPLDIKEVNTFISLWLEHGSDDIKEILDAFTKNDSELESDQVGNLITKEKELESNINGNQEIVESDCEDPEGCLFEIILDLWEFGEFDLDSEIMDMRCYRTIGGLYHLELLSLPPQPIIINQNLKALYDFGINIFPSEDSNYFLQMNKKVEFLSKFKEKKNNRQTIF